MATTTLADLPVQAQLMQEAAQAVLAPGVTARAALGREGALVLQITFPAHLGVRARLDGLAAASAAVREASRVHGFPFLRAIAHR